MDWVTKRATNCSAFEVFRELRAGAKKDAAIRVGLLPKGTPEHPMPDFKVPDGNDPNQFEILREGPKEMRDSVEFRLIGESIHVKDSKGKMDLKATLTLDDEGECRLLVGSARLTCWQFRKMALDDLFFGF